MAPKKKGASEYIKETEAWCAEYGTKYGFPQESADHAGLNLARKLRLNEERFSVADKSALDKMRDQYPQPKAEVKVEPADAGKAKKHKNEVKGELVDAHTSVEVPAEDVESRSAPAGANVYYKSWCTKYREHERAHGRCGKQALETWKAMTDAQRLAFHLVWEEYMKKTKKEVKQEPADQEAAEPGGSSSQGAIEAPSNEEESSNFWYMLLRFRIFDADRDWHLSSCEMWLSIQCLAEFLDSINMLQHNPTLESLWGVDVNSRQWNTWYENFRSIDPEWHSKPGIQFSLWVYFQNSQRKACNDMILRLREQRGQSDPDVQEADMEKCITDIAFRYGDVQHDHDVPHDHVQLVIDLRRFRVDYKEEWPMEKYWKEQVEEEMVDKILPNPVECYAGALCKECGRWLCDCTWCPLADQHDWLVWRLHHLQHNFQKGLLASQTQALFESLSGFQWYGSHAAGAPDFYLSDCSAWCRCKTAAHWH